MDVQLPKNNQFFPQSVLRKKKSSATQKALDHFDDFYKDIFTEDWGSIRHGLLSKQKYVALINNYSDSDETKTKLENLGALNIRVLFKLEKENIQERLSKNKKIRELNKIWEMDKEMDKEVVEQNTETTTQINFSLESSLQNAEIDSSRIIDSDISSSSVNLYEFVPATKIKGMEDFIQESTHYKYYDNTNLSITVQKEYDIHFPNHLDVYSFESSNNTNFDPPRMGSTGVLNYYLMDGGSLLPILALDIKPGNTILDLCAAPGGKSLLAIQTLYPGFLLSNDITNGRVDRLYNVFKTYLYDFNEKWVKTNKIKITTVDGRYIEEENFDRIIVVALI